MIRTLIQRVKLFSSPRKEFYLFLKDLLGFYPGNIKLYELAFVHRSESFTNSIGNTSNNERLEYLGDAILGAVIAEYLYKRFPQRGEGFLTQMRSKLVNRAFLTHLTCETGLSRFVKSRNSVGNASSTSHIYGDAFEALIGAIYIDKGYSTARYVIIKRFLKYYVDLNEVEEADNNYKSQLIEWGQKNKMDVKFHTTEEINGNNSRFNTFVSKIEIGNEIMGQGSGASKKESQQNAAKKTLEHIAELTEKGVVFGGCQSDKNVDEDEDDCGNDEFADEYDNDNSTLTNVESSDEELMEQPDFTDSVDNSKVSSEDDENNQATL